MKSSVSEHIATKPHTHDSTQQHTTTSGEKVCEAETRRPVVSSIWTERGEGNEVKRWHGRRLNGGAGGAQTVV
jgi:hypothetical protein